MLSQLQTLASNRGLVNLSTVRALIDRGLVAYDAATRQNLKIHNRRPGAYPLTEAGRRALEADPE